MSTQILDAVVKSLEEEHWKSLWIETAGETELFTEIPRGNGGFLGMFLIREEQHEWVFDLFYEVKVPENKRQEAAAFLTQVNAGLTRGTFEMNRENGEVYFSTLVMATDQSLTPEEIDHVVRKAVSTAKHFLPGLLAVIRADQPRHTEIPISPSSTPTHLLTNEE